MTDTPTVVTPRLRIGDQRALGGGAVRSIESYPTNRSDDATTSVPEWMGRLTYSFDDGTWDWVDIVDQYLDPLPDPDGLTVDTCLRALTTVAQALLNEATEREWCSEYAEFVDTVNDQLPPGIPKLKHMAREHRVTFTIKVTEEFDAWSRLESHIDTWLHDRDLASCEDFDHEPNY